MRMKALFRFWIVAVFVAVSVSGYLEDFDSEVFGVPAGDAPPVLSLPDWMTRGDNVSLTEISVWEEPLSVLQPFYGDRKVKGRAKNWKHEYILIRTASGERLRLEKHRIPEKCEILGTEHASCTRVVGPDPPSSGRRVSVDLKGAEVQGKDLMDTFRAAGHSYEFFTDNCWDYSSNTAEQVIMLCAEDAHLTREEMRSLLRGRCDLLMARRARPLVIVADIVKFLVTVSISSLLTLLLAVCFCGVRRIPVITNRQIPKVDPKVQQVLRRLKLKIGIVTLLNSGNRNCNHRELSGKKYSQVLVPPPTRESLAISHLPHRECPGTALRMAATSSEHSKTGHGSILYLLRFFKFLLIVLQLIAVNL